MTTCWINFLCAALLAVSAVQAQANEALARKSGCVECHGKNAQIATPSFDAIAERYANEPAAHAALIEIVKYGGKGNWSKESLGAPMPPYARLLSDKEIERLVDWILVR